MSKLLRPFTLVGIRDHDLLLQMRRHWPLHQRVIWAVLKMCKKSFCLPRNGLDFSRDLLPQVELDGRQDRKAAANRLLRVVEGNVHLPGKKRLRGPMLWLKKNIFCGKIGKINIGVCVLEIKLVFEKNWSWHCFLRKTPFFSPIIGKNRRKYCDRNIDPGSIGYIITACTYIHRNFSHFLPKNRSFLVSIIWVHQF
jgi:hypothetical protein